MNQRMFFQRAQRLFQTHFLFLLALTLTFTACNKDEILDQAEKERILTIKAKDDLRKPQLTFNEETGDLPPFNLKEENPELFRHLQELLSSPTNRSTFLNPDVIDLSRGSVVHNSSNTLTVYSFYIDADTPTSFFNLIVEIENDQIQTPFVLEYELDPNFRIDLVNGTSDFSNFKGTVRKFLYDEIFSTNRNIPEHCWELIYGPGSTGGGVVVGDYNAGPAIGNTPLPDGNGGTPPGGCIECIPCICEGHGCGDHCTCPSGRPQWVQVDCPDNFNNPDSPNNRSNTRDPLDDCLRLLEMAGIVLPDDFDISGYSNSALLGLCEDLESVLNGDDPYDVDYSFPLNEEEQDACLKILDVQAYSDLSRDDLIWLLGQPDLLNQISIFLGESSSNIDKQAVNAYVAMLRDGRIDMPMRGFIEHYKTAINLVEILGLNSQLEEYLIENVTITQYIDDSWTNCNDYTGSEDFDVLKNIFKELIDFCESANMQDVDIENIFTSLSVIASSGLEEDDLEVIALFCENLTATTDSDAITTLLSYIDYVRGVIEYTDPLPIPASYWNYQIQYDMTGAPPWSDTNAAGFPRNREWFWKTKYEAEPHMFSENNRIKMYDLDNFVSPVVDAQWIEHNPTHASYNGQKLHHHHMDQGKMAVALPQEVHQKWSKILHDKFRNGASTLKGKANIKNVTNGMNNALNVIGLIIDLQGAMTGDPHSLWIQFQPIAGIINQGQIYYDSNTNTYVEVTWKAEFDDPPTSGPHANWKGAVYLKQYVNYAWDQDLEKYVGIGLLAEGYQIKYTNNTYKNVMQKCYTDDSIECGGI